MKSVHALIDEAVNVCKTKRALASRLGLTEQNLQGVYNGRRFLTCMQSAILADLIDKDATQVWAIVSIEKEQDEPARNYLREAFFRRAIGGAAMVCAFVGSFPTPAKAAITLSAFDNLYIVALLRGLARVVRGRLRVHLAPTLHSRRTPA